MKRWQIIVGVLLIFLGIMALIEAVFKINLWRFFFPLLLIGLGVLLLLRPRMAGSDVKVEMPILGDSRRAGAWEVKNQEFWWLVGSNYLDFTDAIFPSETQRIKIFGFVDDVKIVVPDDVGLRVNSSAFVSEYKTPQGKKEQFLNTLEYETPGFDTMEKRVEILTISFVAEIRIKESLM